MARIGILTCSNTRQNSACSSFMCLKGINENEGEFERYNDNGSAELVGIISCTGCPTAVAPEKILKNVKSLTFLGLDALHLPSCMMALCPFKKKYQKVIEESFPELEIVNGTHAAPPEVEEMFVEGMKRMLTQPQMTMADLASEAENQGVVSPV